MRRAGGPHQVVDMHVVDDRHVVEPDIFALRLIEATGAQADAVSKPDQYDVHDFAKRFQTIEGLARDTKPVLKARPKKSN